MAGGLPVNLLLDSCALIALGNGTLLSNNFPDKFFTLGERPCGGRGQFPKSCK